MTPSLNGPGGFNPKAGLVEMLVQRDIEEAKGRGKIMTADDIEAVRQKYNNMDLDELSAQLAGAPRQPVDELEIKSNFVARHDEEPKSIARQFLDTLSGKQKTSRRAPWYERVADAIVRSVPKAVGVGLLATGAVAAGGAAAAFVTNFAAMSPIVKGLVMAGGFVSMAVGHTACRKEKGGDPTQQLGGINVVQNQEQIVKVDIDALVDSLASGFQDIVDALNHNHQELLTHITSENQQLKDMMQKIIDLLTHIDDMSTQQLALTGSIYSALLNLNSDVNGNHAELIALLNNLLDKVNNMSDQDAANYAAIIALLNSLLSTQSGMADNLEQILAKLNALEGQFPDLQSMLAAILAQLVTMGEQEQTNAMLIIEGIAGNTQMLQQIYNAIQGIAGQNVQTQQLLQQIIAQLLGMNVNINDILAVLNDNNSLLQQIFAELQNLHGTVHQNAQNIVTLIMQGNDLSQQILAAINGLSADLRAYYLGLMGQMQANGMTMEEILAWIQQNNQLLQEILAKLDQIDQNNQAGFLNVVAHLNQIDDHLHEGVIAILNKLDQLNSNQQAGILAILNSIDNLNDNVLNIINHLIDIELKLDEQQQQDYSQYFQTIINKISQLSANQQVWFNDILNAINNMHDDIGGLVVQMLAKLDTIEQNQVTQIQNIAALMDELEACGVTLVEIRDLIGGLNPWGPQADLSVIEQLLAQLLAQSQTNGQVLQQIQGNQTLILAAINSVRNQITVMRDQLGGWFTENNNLLQQILDAIEGLDINCDDCCEQIIIYLEQIIEILQNHDDWNHEGILEEFEDLLGKGAPSGKGKAPKKGKSYPKTAEEFISNYKPKTKQEINDLSYNLTRQMKESRRSHRR